MKLATFDRVAEQAMRHRRPPRQSSATRCCLMERRDCFEFLAALRANSVDLVLTDPPYTISRKTGFQQVKNGVQRFAVSMEFGHWDTEPIDLQRLAAGLYRALRQGGTAIIWYDLWKFSHLSDAMSAAGFKMLRFLIWEKTNPVPLNQKATYLSNSREIAVVGVKGGKPTFHSRYDNGVYRAPIPRHNGSRIHPTQKPLDIFTQLVRKHSNRGDLVIDPFLGSGTSAIAALKTGRKFLGCDINAGYIKKARQRFTSCSGRGACLS